MYYCLKCNKTHELSKPGKIFMSGFTEKDGKEINVGICEASESTKSNSDVLEEKLAYLLRHAC